MTSMDGLCYKLLSYRWYLGTLKIKYQHGGSELQCPFETTQTVTYICCFEHNGSPETFCYYQISIIECLVRNPQPSSLIKFLKCAPSANNALFLPGWRSWPRVKWASFGILYVSIQRDWPLNRSTTMTTHALTIYLKLMKWEMCCYLWNEAWVTSS